MQSKPQSDIPSDAICHEHMIMGCTLSHKPPQSDSDNIRMTCTSIDCHERTGGECNASISDGDELTKELVLRFDILVPLVSDVQIRNDEDASDGVYRSTHDLYEIAENRIKELIDQALAKQREDMLAALPKAEPEPNLSDARNEADWGRQIGFNNCLDQVRDIISNGGKK